jgi:hypothetical protein
MNESDELELERLVSGALRQLPARSAPPSLERRVLAELARHAARPWWRRSFAHWPRVALTGFVSLCGGLIAVTFLGGTSVGAGLGSAPVLRQAWTLAAAASQTLAALVRSVPSIWLYEGLAAATVLYALLFALGVTAYRTLYLEA